MRYLTLLGVIFSLSFSLSYTVLGVAEQPSSIDEIRYAQQLRSATFFERTPGFNDLYMIETPDKGRQIVIYCNPNFCYKFRGDTLTA